MKVAHAVLAMLVLALAGCGAQPAVPLASLADSHAAAASGDENLRLGPVRFTAKVNGYTPLTPYAYVTLIAKPLVGRTVRDSEFVVTVAGKALANDRNTMVLGRGGQLYVSAHQRFNNGKEGDLYNFGTDFYAVGTYAQPKTFVDGAPLNFKLAEGVSLERHTEWDIAFGNQDRITIHFAGTPAVSRKPELVPAPPSR